MNEKIFNAFDKYELENFNKYESRITSFKIKSRTEYTRKLPSKNLSSGKEDIENMRSYVSEFEQKLNLDNLFFPFQIQKDNKDAL